MLSLNTVTTVVAIVISVAVGPCLYAGQLAEPQRVESSQRPADRQSRDPQPVLTGTGVIRGRVFSSETGRPLRRARVTLSGAELASSSKTTSTGIDGRYEFKDLPSGRYELSVTRSGYLTLRYGQRRPLEQGKLLQVADRQVIDKVDFSLPRMSIITGRITDELGEPIAGVKVMALRSMYFQGSRRMVPVGGMGSGGLHTDDTGQYRMLNLVPGTYFVMATVRETWTESDSGGEHVMGYAPTYFPGVTALASAKRVALGIGEEASNIDFSLVPGRSATISGTATSSQGRALAGRTVELNQEFRGPTSMAMVSVGSSTVGGDGTFTFKNIPPGDYSLFVLGSDFAGEASAVATVSVDGIDLDVTLTASPRWSVSGSISSDTGLLPEALRSRIRLASRPMRRDTMVPRVGSQVKEDWTFTLRGLAGPNFLSVTAPDWFVKAILQNGRDITETPIEAKDGEELSGVHIVLTKHMAAVNGQLIDDKGAPVADGSVIVFATDAERWIQDSRFVRYARPDQDGRYQVTGLPPGEYLAVALDYVEDGMWNDPEFLESLRRYGEKITLSDRQSQTVSLKIIKPNVRF